MLRFIKNELLLNLKNIPGWRTDRKVIIIECDDWGGIRMPSKEVYDKLYISGLKVNSGWHSMFDTLANDEDLKMLFDVLCSVKDKNGCPAVMTAMVNVANPDFHKIKLSGFSEYFYEPFTETLKRYYPGKDVFKVWQEGIDKGIFVPEFHGREHITVQLWLDMLRQGNDDLLFAFDNGFVSLAIEGCPEPAQEFRPELYFSSDDQKPFLVNSIKTGCELFKEIFGYNPRVFVPSNGIIDPFMDVEVAKAGIKFLWVNHKNAYPDKGELKYRHFVSGQRGPDGLIYYTRNCAFEPNDPSYKGVDFTIKQISAAFRWGKPGSISTHRANYVGGIDKNIGLKGRSELKTLLKAIVKKWPDVEFMSSASALKLMKDRNSK